MAMDKDLMKALVMELIGTFLLAFSVGAGGDALSVGITLAVIVYAGGPISGGCYNPAVALAAMLNGALGEIKKDWLKLLMYWGVEALGGLLGMMLGYMSRRDDKIMACVDVYGAQDYYNFLEAILMEFFWVTFLCYVVLATACTKEKEGNHYFGWCIGFALSIGLMGAPVNGGGLNPALALGNYLGGSIVKPKDNKCASDNFEHIWWLIIMPLLGGVAGWGLHLLTNPKQYGKAKLEKFAPYIQEFFGTFYFVFAISISGLSANYGNLLNGTCLAVVIFCGGHVSGGQYNPAVSLGVFIRGVQDLKKTLFFILCQLGGSFAGALMGYALTRIDEDNVQDPAPVHQFVPDEDDGLFETDVMAAWLGEFVFTFMLVLVVLLTATWDKVEANNYFGLAIGYTVVAGSFSVGSFSAGGALNPAVWFGTNLMYVFHENFDHFGFIWVYWTSELLAGVAAGFLFKFLTGVNDKIGGGGGGAVAPAGGK